MRVTLKSITPDIETTIVEIARVSSSRKDKTENPEGLINYLIKNRHWSPFEHGFLTFEVETSKAIGIQLLRHRSNYFQEFSQRYQDVNKVSGEDEGIFEEIELRQQATDNRQSSTEVFNPMVSYELAPLNGEPQQTEILASGLIDKLLKESEKVYNSLLEAGVAREVARMVLPMATKTKMFITMNVRSVIHWLDLRDDGHAQKEIQLIAKEVKKIVIEQLPLISAARGYTQTI
jgi:thymidylate synthase (FAD)